jgi:serine protease Do
MRVGAPVAYTPRRGAMPVLGAGLLLSLAAACAATPAASPATTAAAQLEALQRASASVVGLQVDAIPGAGSGDSLGWRRTGSGVVIGPNGLVLTIGYLLIEAQNIELTTPDAKTLPARQVGYDVATGFGLVQPLVPMHGVPAVPLGSSAALAPGDTVLAAIGASSDGGGGGAGMTQLVSKRAFSGYWEYHIEAALFTSPPVPSHSGAGLFNRKGELVGIGSLFTTDALGSPERGLAGNMFVPIDLLKPVLAELRATGSTRAGHRPWLGITSTEQRGRVEILRVNRDSPAQQAGLQAGDVVLEIDGAKVATLEAFYKKLWSRGAPDAEVELTVLQGAEIHKVRLKAIDRLLTLRKPVGI